MAEYTYKPKFKISKTPQSITTKFTSFQVIRELETIKTQKHKKKKIRTMNLKATYLCREADGAPHRWAN